MKDNILTSVVFQPQAHEIPNTLHTDRTFMKPIRTEPGLTSGPDTMVNHILPCIMYNHVFGPNFQEKSISF